MLRSITRFCSDEFLVVALPRVLVLQNRRLGVFYKLLQAGFIILVVFYFLASHQFQKPYQVESWGGGVWFEEGTHGGEAIPLNCADLLTPYTHDHGTTGFSYKPTACKVLPTAESSITQQSGLFQTTFVDDILVWQGKDSACGALAKVACENRNESSAAVYEEVAGSGSCSCTFREQFLVSNVGESRIRLSYGYQVDYTGGTLASVYRGGLLSSANSEGRPPHDLEERSTDLVTEFLAPDGSACNFGGKSEWHQDESVGGISGTLNELLNCAGVTLDSNPTSLLAGNFPAPPHFRTMGLKIEFHVEIHQQVFGRRIAYVRTEAVPQVTSFWDTHEQVSSFPATTASSRRHSRRMHGVAMSTPRVHGTIYHFDWVFLVKGFVDVAVLLGVPRFLLFFASMYLLGPTSDVYRNCARTKISVFNKFQSSIAKMMVAEVAYRGIMKDFATPMGELEQITPKMLWERLEDIFGESKELQPEEIENMVRVVFEQMDKDKSGHMSCSEFVRACTDDGEMSLKIMENFFDKNKGVPCCRLLLDSTISETRRSVARNTSSTGSITWRDADLGAISDGSEANDAEKHEVNTPELLMEGATQPAKEEEVSTAKLLKRLQDLEMLCEQALASLRDAIRNPSDSHPGFQNPEKPGNVPRISESHKHASCARHLAQPEAPWPPASPEHSARSRGSSHPLQHAAAHLRADRSVIMAAVQKNGLALKFVADIFRADKDVVLAAVCDNGCALQYASGDLKADQEVVMAAVQGATPKQKQQRQDNEGMDTIHEIVENVRWEMNSKLDIEIDHLVKDARRIDEILATIRHDVAAVQLKVHQAVNALDGRIDITSKAVAATEERLNMAHTSLNDRCEHMARGLQKALGISLTRNDATSGEARRTQYLI